MLMPACRARLKARGRARAIVALEPSASPSLTTGKGGPHRVEGIATRFIAAALGAGQARRSARDRRSNEGRAWHRAAREEGIFRRRVVGFESRRCAASSRASSALESRRDDRGRYGAEIPGRRSLQELKLERPLARRSSSFSLSSPSVNTTRSGDESHYPPSDGSAVMPRP